MVEVMSSFINTQNLLTGSNPLTLDEVDSEQPQIQIDACLPASSEAAPGRGGREPGSLAELRNGAWELGVRSMRSLW